MAFTLTFSGNSSSLSSEFFPPIELNENNYVCGLVDFQTYNSIPNIDETNNTFFIGNTNVVLPEGAYEIQDIEKYINKWLGVTKEDDKEKKVQIKANNNTLKCDIFSTENIDFTKPNSIASTLGFNPQILHAKLWHVSDNNVDINKINIIRVECNIIGGTYINGEQAHILHEFSIRVSPGYKVIEVPRNVIYLPVNVKQISSLTIKIVDQNGNLINFRGETITLRLHFKLQ